MVVWRVARLVLSLVATMAARSAVESGVHWAAPKADWLAYLTVERSAARRADYWAATSVECSAVDSADLTAA